MNIDLQAFFDPRQVLDNTDVLLAGAWTTIELSVVSAVMAGVVGVILSTTRSSRWRMVSGVTRTWIELVRGTPLLVQMYLLYYGLPSLGITLSPLVAAALALGLNSGAYVCEILRSALTAVVRAQSESARALGMGHAITQIRVVYPQAIPIALPGLIGEVIDIVKWSSIASIVVVPEATQVVSQIVAQSYRGFGIMFLTLALFYLALTFSLSTLSRRLEKRITRYRVRVAHA
ncbi:MULTISPECIES: amino acid ABC transporter permease [unclassified Variovorax]|uniref:amino acid ABC transporter permease n=1 Tax=unclassified Variovorax TaxID=663243 RepID=UPI001318C26F|nr:MULTISPECIES: amino acid ABC transporter permease [unclassified Variovorax]VTU12992.1 Inner membrane amino-acid ABC transporter permease protein YecS [Variovorax sp. SRS16]VTU16811.1 Inner membrane amino-acid ABC transporter permease protein YecS [Variovorax sp. PBL-E5]